MVVARGCKGEGNGEFLFNKYGVSVEKKVFWLFIGHLIFFLEKCLLRSFVHFIFNIYF